MGSQNIESIYRLSPLQEGILYHAVESAGSGVYFQQYSCLLNHPVESVQLEKAWNMVAARHSALRTLFTWEQRDRPLQIVRERVTIPWKRLDWQTLSPDEQEEQWFSLLQRDRDRGFDLTRAPLTRICIIQLDRDRQRLLWSFHHLLLDGWSVRLILDEVATVYHALLQGRDPQLPAAPPYSRFISWLEKRESRNDRAFWEKLLNGFVLPTHPAAEPSPPGPGKRYALTRSGIDSETLLRLNHFARQERLTLNTLVVGAWALVMSRYCNRDDVVFGTTVSGRPTDLDGAESIAGLFINTLPLRAVIEPEESVSVWLHRIQRLQLEIRAFEQTALSDIQRWSDLPPGTPLFRTILVFENFPPRRSLEAAGGGLEVSEETFVEFSNFPLAILAVPGDELELIAVHDCAQYSSSFCARILEHLKSALENLLRWPEQRVARLPIISDTETRRLLDDWNDTAREFPGEQGIHQLIEQVVERSPEAVAVRCRQEQVSYRALNSRANRLARHLITLGVSRDTPVAILLDRSIDAVVSVLGVLKAGGAYVPLDPRYPAERITLLLQDLAQAMPSGSPVMLITSRKYLVDPAASGCQVLCIDGDWQTIAAPDDTNPDLPIDPAQLAYIIYTSGTTGRPKGVLVPHAGLVNSTTARQNYYPASPARFLLLSSFATDSSVAGLFWTLCDGGALILPATRLEQDILQLRELIDREEVTHLLCVPSLYQLLLDYTAPGQMATLRTVIVAGEACGRNLTQRHGSLLPDIPLYNEYGPTEATVWATVARVDATTPAGGRTPIGRPIQNTTIYILDRRGKPAAVGLPGELYIGGAGVALGYLNQPQTTGDRFVANPFRSLPDPRLYRTGDLARYLEDGTIEFLGRVDNQVKIRGYRVELEEIEAVLTGHPGVREAAVTYDDPRREPPTVDDSTTIGILLDALESMDSEEADVLLSAVQRLDEEQIEHELSGLTPSTTG